VSNRSKTVSLLDDLVVGHLHDQRYREAERLRRFEIDDEFEVRGLLHRKLGGLPPRPAQNLIDVVAA
jgi:hypothetical protein